MNQKYKFTSSLLCLFLLAGCVNTPTENTESSDVTVISLNNEKILINDQEINNSNGVSISNDIIYYEEGKDESYGEGDENDSHSEQEANKHQVIKITEPGTYRISGELDYGQLLIDLGEDAKEDPNAVVNLILDNVALTSTVSSAIVVLNAYECATEEASASVNTDNAGFNLILADDSVNSINGSHVAKIYEEGTQDKLYKFDGAIESYVSLNIDGERKNNGQLNVQADREGIESGMHITINGGNIHIESCDDAINASEDGISVLTINNGSITALSTFGSEGDGMDSNGWIVINGGTVVAVANPQSMDSGVDSDNGVIINKGTLLATGNMYDEIAKESNQQFIVMNLSTSLEKDTNLALKDSNEETIAAFKLPENSSVMVYSSADLVEDTYTLYQVNEIKATLKGYLYSSIESLTDLTQIDYSNSNNMRKDPSKNMPEGTPPERPHENDEPIKPDQEFDPNNPTRLTGD